MFTDAGAQEDVSSPFDIGTFTHNNFSISAPSITGADLKVTVKGTVEDGGTITSFDLGGIFRFEHFETPNSYPCAVTPSESKCDDEVTFLGAVSFFGDPIVVDGDEFVFGLEGFEAGTTFLTEEHKSNTASLMGTFTSTPLVFNDPEPVPLPAAGLLLLGALGGLRLVQRKKKST